MRTPLLRIVLRLLPGSYSTRRERLQELRERIPELRDMSEREVKREVENAVEWTIRHICDTQAIWRTMRENIAMYECLDPKTGRFYLVRREVSGTGTEEYVQDFILTESESEAISEFLKMGMKIEERKRQQAQRG